MAGEFGGLSFRGGMAGLLGTIGRFFTGFGGITAKDLLRHIAYLKDNVTSIETQHAGFLWGLGKVLGGGFATLAAFIRDHAKPALQYLGDKIVKIEKWLRDKFGPVLAFLKKVKDKIDAIYKQWIKPIVDTIEFIRAVNRVLQVFHIDLLKALDRKLAQIEQRIEDPFLWVRSHITELENWVDRIVTADGLFQRIALLRSLDSYAPEWVKSFWDKQATGISPGVAEDLRNQQYPVKDPAFYGTELGNYLRDRPSEIGGLTDELVPLWLEASQGRAA